MAVPIEYVRKFVTDPASVFDRLWSELDWQRRDLTPRLEYYCNDFGVPYTYGRGAGVRTYEPQPYHPVILEIRENLEALTGTKFEVCFLNGYRDGSDQLGWHADDSPEMDDERPIAIVSLGARREIYFKPQHPVLYKCFSGFVDPELVYPVTKLWLDSGSLCLMLPGMQDTHFHRIPKSSVANCGPRVSLTFRGYVNAVSEL
jgi:alkylated DNA repair dioxygenase AlkB